MTRNEINSWKNKEVSRIERETSTAMKRDRKIHEDRSAIIKAIGEAAQRCDFTMMAELKAQLAKCS